MSNILYRATYRPLRVGFCVNRGDKESLVTAFRYAHCLWGGRFNPVIVVDDDQQASQLVKAFKVDVLFAIGGGKAEEFAKSIPHLSWPFTRNSLFENDACKLIDISHPLSRFYAKNVHARSYAYESVTVFDWSSEDSCGLVFEAMFGQYPKADSIGIDYRVMVNKLGAGMSKDLDPAQHLHLDFLRTTTPNKVSSMELMPGVRMEGMFVGHRDSFDDVVRFWNLRASSIDLYFVDPRDSGRFNVIAEGFRRELTNSQGKLPSNRIFKNFTSESVDPVAIAELQEGLQFPKTLLKCYEEQQLGRVGLGNVYIKKVSCLAHLTQGQQGPIATVPIVEKPWSDAYPSGGQAFVAVLQPVLDFSRDNAYIFDIPWTPSINNYLRQRHSLSHDAVRVHNDGIGILTRVDSDHILLRGLERFSFIYEFFRILGIEATTSNAGRICDHLIRQMGGVQGARVFKIKGVRDLIREFNPNQSFTRSQAIQRIRGPVTEENGNAFDTKYGEMCIEFSEAGHTKLKPADVFSFLLKKGVLRVGLEPECCHCHFRSWRSIDELDNLLVCDFCGGQFEILTQLKDRDWSFRPSGLFGRQDHQEGAIPVALTLQQLDFILSRSQVLWWPSLNLVPTSSGINACEIDFLVVTRANSGEPEILIGECKENSEISSDDVRNLTGVAELLRGIGAKVYVVFSKTGEFTPSELSLFRNADSGGKWTILLSQRELEEMEIFQKSALGNDAPVGHPSLEQLVEVTGRLFYGDQNEEAPS